MPEKNYLNKNFLAISLISLLIPGSWFTATRSDVGAVANIAKSLLYCCPPGVAWVYRGVVPSDSLILLLQA